MRRALPFLLLSAACSAEAGVDGSEILAPYSALSGGLLFATSASSIPGVNGYDLFWAPIPSFQTTDPQPLVRLTNASGNEWQPSVSRGGNGFVFARPDDGIFLVSTSGRITRVSDVADRYKDSLPALSFDGTRVAWVREDRLQPIGETGFFETFVMMANFDGTEARVLSPRPGIIQDAPTFEPRTDASRIAWSEFNVATITGAGPSDYGIWIHDFRAGTGRYACMSPGVELDERGWPYRCFGQHLTWVMQSGFNFVVAPQDMLEVNVDTGQLSTVWATIIHSIQTQQFGTPDIADDPQGFFPRFPLSVSYSPGMDRMVFDGIISPLDGDDPTLAFFSAGVDGGGVWRIQLSDYFNDIDQSNTADYLFSVATPQIVP
ncbi:hypothetical protein L6R52_30660 [Myxococcota bacterium]|nr:hypothetical protein [Myxococcota bacterium]